ncbi:MAG: alanine racemase [Candidatus Paceibacterota bacterium]
MQPREYNSNALRTWIDVDTKVLEHNYNLFREVLSKETTLCAVVKSNAYGHSLVDYAKQMEGFGVDWLAVDTLVEGLRLREEGITAPILVLGYTLPDMFTKAADNDISIMISGFESLGHALRYAGKKPLKIHIKCDTGMHRQGFLEGQIKKAVRDIRKAENPKVVIEGVFTHFADAKNPSEPRRTQEQIEIFERVRQEFVDAGHSPIVHAAATSTTVIFPEAHYDMVRVGIGLYGLWPSVATKQYAQEWLPLQPVLSWKSVVSEVKAVPAGSQFGYGFTESVARDSKIAVIPIGYWHGYPRSLSSIGHMLIRGKRAKVLGTVSMDITVVDVTDIKGVKAGDEVMLIGKDGKDDITADELAGMTGTINYEIVTRINPLIKRFYV